MPTIDEILSSMQEVFKQSGTSPQDVYQVVLTGGTSQLPLMRAKFAELFGEAKLKQFNVYDSVVNGLAKFAQSL